MPGSVLLAEASPRLDHRVDVQRLGEHGWQLADGGTEPIGVTVNGVVATVAGGSFTASVPLVEGANTVTATATNAFGEASASTPVTLDTTPPVVTITSPANGSLTAEASTSVTGTVFDASPIASLTVNGVVATLTGSAFSASVPLADGANPITATATAASTQDSRMRSCCRRRRTDSRSV